jgi:hypothetical protein
MMTHLRMRDPSFRRDTASKFFSRKYKLDFVTVILLILQNSIKPMQLVLNEFFKRLDNGIMVTKSAFTQARSHLKATVFVVPSGARDLIRKPCLMFFMVMITLRKHGAFAY